jgi:hypothetical protein
MGCACARRRARAPWRAARPRPVGRPLPVLVTCISPRVPTCRAEQGLDDRPPFRSDRTVLRIFRQLAARTVKLAERNHTVRACDFVRTHDIWFRPVSAFFIVDVNSRRVVHLAVTRTPSGSGPRSSCAMRRPSVKGRSFSSETANGPAARRGAATANAPASSDGPLWC